MQEDIEKRIKLLGIKKTHVAQKIGASPSELSHYLSGRRDLSPEKKERLKMYLSIN